MTKAANGQARLIPYPVIEAAVSGDADAVNQVIRHYSGYIATLCKRIGRDERGNFCTYVDEELRRRLETKLITCVLAIVKIRITVVLPTQSEL